MILKGSVINGVSVMPDWMDGEIDQSKPLLTPAEVGRLLKHNEALRGLLFSAFAIKCGISGHTGDLSTAQEAWDELSDDEQTALYIAPSKGGIFTTAERKVIKSGFKE